MIPLLKSHLYEYVILVARLVFHLWLTSPTEYPAHQDYTVIVLHYSEQ